MSSIAPAPENTASKQAQSRSKSSSTTLKALDAAASTAAAADPPASSSSDGWDNSNIKNKDNTIDPVLQSISQKAVSSVLLQPTITITLYIPTASVGAVIGRRGQNIALIQKVASQAATTSHPVRVSVIGSSSSSEAAAAAGTTTAPSAAAAAPTTTTNTTDPVAATAASSNLSLPYTYSELDFTDPHWTPVVIRADPKAAFTAAQKLEESVLLSNNTSSSSNTTIMKMDQVVVDVPLGRQKHACIVGKRGLVLANLSADTGVRIMVPNKDLRHDIVQLEGDLCQVKICLERLLQIVLAATTSGSNISNKQQPQASSNHNPLASSSRNTSTANSSNTTGGDQQQQYSHTQTLLVEHLLSQTKLRGLARKTDTVIKKKRVEVSSTTATTATPTTSSQGTATTCWQLTVSGNSAEQVQLAIHLLQKATDQQTKATTTTTVTTADGTTTTTTPGTSSQQQPQQQSSSRRGNKVRGRGGTNKRGGGGGTTNKPLVVAGNKDGAVSS